MNTNEKAAYMAKTWCDKHKGWIRISDIDTSAFDYEDLGENPRLECRHQTCDSTALGWLWLGRGK